MENEPPSSTPNPPEKDDEQSLTKCGCVLDCLKICQVGAVKCCIRPINEFAKEFEEPVHNFEKSVRKCAEYSSYYPYMIFNVALLFYLLKTSIFDLVLRQFVYLIKCMQNYFVLLKNRDHASSILGDILLTNLEYLAIIVLGVFNTIFILKALGQNCGLIVARFTTDSGPREVFKKKIVGSARDVGTQTSSADDSHFFVVNTAFLRYQLVQFALIGPVQLFFQQTFWDHKTYIKYEVGIYAYEVARFTCLASLTLFLVLWFVVKNPADHLIDPNGRICQVLAYLRPECLSRDLDESREQA